MSDNLPLDFIVSMFFKSLKSIDLIFSASVIANVLQKWCSASLSVLNEEEGKKKVQTIIQNENFPDLLMDLINEIKTMPLKEDDGNVYNLIDALLNCQKEINKMKKATLFLTS